MATSRLRTFVLMLALVTAPMVAPACRARTQQGQPTGLANVIHRDWTIDGRRVAILAADWLYCYPPTRELILVPKGYATDFASIPGPMRGLIDVYGLNIEGAVVHDWLYAVGEPGQRGKADDIIRYALMEQGVDVVRRNAVHRAVRQFGGEAYGRAGEWDRRFGDPATGQALPGAPYRRRTTAVVGRIDGSCAAMENRTVLQDLHRAYASDAWPPPQ